MITLNIIERAEVPAGWLEQMKTYAAVPDGAQDSLLKALLLRAVLRVQELANKSLLACTIELHEDDVEDNLVRLYQTVSEVVSVSTPVGHRLYWEPRSNGIRVYEPSVVVTYKTEPREGDVENLLPVVFQYATALYDGQDTKTLASILSQCQ
jgi:hypothetical protein